MNKKHAQRHDSNNICLTGKNMVRLAVINIKLRKTSNIDNLFTKAVLIKRMTLVNSFDEEKKRTNVRRLY